MTATSNPRRAASVPALLRGGRAYVWLTLVGLIVAAASLAYPSTPSYDPYSWLIWGREILHGGLQISGGSSWKPLPVIFTTVLALFGSAQPNLWLLVARGGAVVAVLMSAKLAARITWNLTLRSRGHERGGWDGVDWGSLGWGDRIAAIAPAGLAGAIAAIGTGFAPTVPDSMALGYSEGLMAAAALIAAERAWDGHHRQAFALGLVAALDRPEVWLIWGPYGLWLMWKDRGARPLVIGLAILMLALWVGPQKLGGGSASGIISHARQNHSARSAVYSSFPFWHELYKVVWPLTLERVEFAALVEIALTLVLVSRTRRRVGDWMAALRQHGAAVAAALAGTTGFLWWLVIALETQAGFAGNTRYAVLGVMLVYVGGCAAYGWACLGIPQLVAAALSRLTPPHSRSRRTPRQSPLRRPGWGVRTAASTALVTVVFLFLPGWFAHRMPTISSIRLSLRYQARLREEVASLIQRAGGAKRVTTCGSVMTNDLQVTMVAWSLDVPIDWIQATPNATTKVERGPNVIFQDGDTSGATPLPSDQQIRVWEQGGSRYKVIRTDPVTLYMDCSPYSST